MSADRDSGPQPTAHEVVPGCSLDRRTFITSTAAAAAIAAGGTASTGTVAADAAVSGIVDGVKSAITGAASSDGAQYAVASTGVAGFVAVASYRALMSDIDTSPSTDPALLHNMATSEGESLATHEVVFHNRLVDAQPVANLEARHGAATDWEDGANSNEGYDTAIQHIRQFYETPEWNHYHVTNKSLLQLSYIAGAAEPMLKDGGTYENFDGYLTGVTKNGDYQLQLTDERQEQAIDLHDGTPITDVAEEERDDILGDDYEEATFEVPMVDVFDISAETVVDSFPVISKDLLNSWDEENELVSFDVDSTTVEWDYSFTVPSYAQADLETERVFDGRHFAELMHQIWDDSDHVAGNYDSTFISNLYDELDAGNITPEQVRSPEGMVHFLSGTDDPSNERFRVAMLQQFGMEQPDFSMVSGMNVTWTGATETEVDTDPELDTRNAYPSGYVEGKEYDGVVFGNDLPERGYQPGEKYAVGLPLFVGDGESTVLDAAGGRRMWTFSEEDGDPDTIAVAPDGEMVFSVHNTDTVHAGKPNTTETEWTTSLSGSVTNIEPTPDSETVLASSTTDGLVALDAYDGSENWTYVPTGESVRSVAINSDGTEAFVGTGDGEACKIDPADGSEEWAVTPSTSGGRLHQVALSSDDSVLIASDHTNDMVFGFDAADGTELWSYEHTDSVGDGCTYSEQLDVALIGFKDGQLHALNKDTGDREWRVTLEDTPDELVADPATGMLFVCITDLGDLIEAYDLKDLEQNLDDANPVWSIDLDSNPHGIDVMPVSEDISGVAGRSMVFDEGVDGSEGEGQIDLWDGVLEVNEMYDSGGATITHTDEQTISDLEAATGEDIDTILGEMAEYDDESDIKYTRDVINILEHYNAEDEQENVHTEEPDYDRPEYDTYDSEEFAAYINTVEEYQEQLENQEEDDEADEDDGIGIGLPGFDFGGGGGQLVGLGIIAVVVLAVVGFVTDLIPGLGNN
ncbi:PQQ-binding-like beta-propeller repeat protein [Natronorubrum sp. FCH18a]|uniref:PQQ-binding-like beta-propeller repeat protein n=1 Tax=Natronorubrum sp. FCH18a TaxID=3447018 RepID=UPI003F518BC6